MDLKHRHFYITCFIAETQNNQNKQKSLCFGLSRDAFIHMYDK